MGMSLLFAFERPLLEDEDPDVKPSMLALSERVMYFCYTILSEKLLNPSPEAVPLHFP